MLQNSFLNIYLFDTYFPLGTGPQQRVGSSVWIKSVQMRWQYHSNDAAVSFEDDFGVFRHLLIYSKTLAASATYLGAGANTHLKFTDWSETGPLVATRNKIVWDREVQMTPRVFANVSGALVTGTGDILTTYPSFSKYLRRKWFLKYRRNVQFDNVGNGSVRYNDLLWQVHNGTPVEGYITAQWKIRYYDN